MNKHPVRTQPGIPIIINLMALMIVLAFQSGTPSPVRADEGTVPPVLSTDPGTLTPTSPAPGSATFIPSFLPTASLVPPTVTSDFYSKYLYWLHTPPGVEYLSTDRPLAFLAGELIFHGLVDASRCPGNGLTSESSASPCGVSRARNAVILWQNQFDATLLDASRRMDVPPYLLKNVIIQESQFWPANNPTPYGYSEMGLGHVTEMGADTLLRWDNRFYNEFCGRVYSSETCRKSYIYLPLEQQATLRGAVMQKMNVECAGCPGGFDFGRARESIYYIAAVLRANYLHVEWKLGRSINRPITDLYEQNDLWRFALAGYNAGPGCLSTAMYRAQAAGERFSWKNVSVQFDKGCAGAVKYVNKIAQFQAASAQSLLAAAGDKSRAAQIVRTNLGIGNLVTATATIGVGISPTPTIEPTTSLTPDGTILVTPLTGEPTITGSEIPSSETPEPQETQTVSAETLIPTVTPTPEETATPLPTIPPTETPLPPIILPTQVPGENPATNNIVIKFNDLVPSPIENAIINSAGAQVEGHLDALDLTIVSVSAGQAQAVLDQLNGNLLVAYAEPNYSLGLFHIPNDPGFTNQTYLNDLQVPDAWDISRGEGVIVAVIDTGVDTSHPELVSNLWTNAGETGMDSNGRDKQTNGIDDDGNGYVDDWQGWNFVNGNADVDDDHGHGTHSAGIIAAQMDNATGVAGIAPSAQVMTLKALDASGYGSYAQAAEAILYAVDNGARVINLGFGGTNDSEALLAATNYAYEHGVIVVAAAGNTGSLVTYYPAANLHVIGVSALDGERNITSFSSFGYAVDVAAPGIGIYSTLPGGGFGTMSGTSMSSAEVAGVAALLASQPLSTPDTVSLALFGSALDLGTAGHDIYYGNGLVRALDALMYNSSGTHTPIGTLGADTHTPGPSGTGGVNIQAVVVETLWGTAQTCSFAITNPANSIDSTLGDDTASCAGTFAPNNIWQYTAVSNLTNIVLVQSVVLDVRYQLSGFAGTNPDTILLQVSNDNGGTWTTLSSYSSAQPLTTQTFSLTTLFPTMFDTVAEVNAAQFRFFGGTRAGGADTITIALDEARFTVTGDTSTATPTATATNTPTFTPTFTPTSPSGNTPPTVSITSPTNGSTFLQGATVTFAGTATDAQDGNVTANLAWISSIDGAIGNGVTFNRSNLSVGTHIITASVTDSGGLVGSAAITITINAVNVAPVANNDYYNTPKDTPLTVPAPGILANDSDLNGNPLTAGSFTALNPSSGGTLTTNANGSFTFTPTAGFTGSVSFTYRANDGSLDSNIATVTITVSTPHGPYGAMTDECARCHRTHTAASRTLINSATSPLDSDTFCLSCHGTDAVTVSTHSNADFASRTEAAFEVRCIQCHDPHGSANWFNIRSSVIVRLSPRVTTGPVLFTSLTGTNSFDDGTSITTSRICVTCHINTSNSGYPMVNHTGGASHNGGTNYTSQDCTTCHLHSTDSNPNTRDGFMPNGCRGCHSTVRGTRRQIVSTGGDFVRSSHHVNGTDTVTDADCEVCHDQSTHMAGTVRLKNVDTGASLLASDNAQYEAFCNSCHDTNGAAGDSTPFSDNVAVIVINNSTWWTNASHNIPKGAFTASCKDCHDNGHGSNKLRLLAPWNYINDGNTDDGMMQEERFCFNCHSPIGTAGFPKAGTATKNMYSGFNVAMYFTDAATQWGNVNLNDRHDVQKAAQNVSGAVMECGSCHDPHRDNASAPPMSYVRPDPDSGDGRVPGTNWFQTMSGSATDAYSEWCLDCHDGSYAAGVTAPTSALINILNGGPYGGATSSWITASHGAGPSAASLKAGTNYWGPNSVVACWACHQAHPNNTILPCAGSTRHNSLFQVRDIIVGTNGTLAIPSDNTPTSTYQVSSLATTKNDCVNSYFACNTCHVSSMGSGKANCFSCHLHGDGRW